MSTLPCVPVESKCTQIEEVPTISRKEVKAAFLQIIDRAISTYHGTRGGGSVRDQILGVEPKDWDVFFNIGYSGDFSNFERWLIETFPKTKRDTSKSSFEGSMSYIVDFGIGGLTLKLDLIRKDMRQLKFDFDVNSLKISGDGNSIGIFENKQNVPKDIFKMMEQIRRKEFNILENSCTAFGDKPISFLDFKDCVKLQMRVCKMIERGWTCLNLDILQECVFTLVQTVSDDISCAKQNCTEVLEGKYVYKSKCCGAIYHFDCILKMVNNNPLQNVACCFKCNKNTPWM